MHTLYMGIGHNHHSPEKTSGHSHAGGHEGHNHFHANSVDPRNEKRMAIAAILTGTFMVAELIGGILSGSLALIADAGHMLTDCAALTLAWLGFRLSKRDADTRLTFGYDRFAIIAAFVNGLSLFAISAWIIIEAIQRFNHPVEVMGLPMLIVASLGMAVNILVFVILLGADKENLNIRGAVLHVLGDLLGSVAAIGAAIIIMMTGWMAADLIMSVLVCLIILRSAWYVVKHSGHILMEGAPQHLDREAISADLHVHFPQIVDVDHIHVWSISQERPILTLVAQILPDSNIEETTQAIKSYLQDTYAVEHTTVEINT